MINIKYLFKKLQIMQQKSTTNVQHQNAVTKPIKTQTN